ncbi:MAG: alpha/beta hydrolase, partial [Alphaproteobacteria bacterium CG11_big_fil_rev_8_21_14_0_20_44_7]
SLADIGAKQFPFIPARYLLLDRYDSLQKIAKVDEKLRIVHGSKDNLVPIALGKELYNAANEPKEFITLEGVGHNDVSLDAIADNIIGFTNAR